MILVALAVGWMFYGPSVLPFSNNPEGKALEDTGNSAGSIKSEDLSGQAENENDAINDANIHTSQESPYLLDRLPFTAEEVTAITVGGHGSSYDVPEERRAVLLNSLRFTDMDSALAEPLPAASRQPVVLQFALPGKSFDLTYDLTANAFEHEGQYYYADDQVLLLLQGLLQEREELASLDALLEQARVEQEQAEPADPKALAPERAEVAGLDYLGWEQRLEQAGTDEIEWTKPFYDDNTGEVKQARLYQDGVLLLNRMVVFTQANYATQDGIKPGISAGEVERKLGSEASKLTSRWSYKLGDYFRFHVYYQKEQVQYVVLSQPL